MFLKSINPENFQFFSDLIDLIMRNTAFLEAFMLFHKG